MANEELEKLSSSLKQMQDKFTSDWAGKIESQIDLKATKHREILETGRGTRHLFLFEFSTKIQLIFYYIFNSILQLLSNVYNVLIFRYNNNS